MKGKHRVVLKGANFKYDFTIQRKITLIRGDSATGKSTLVNALDSVKRGNLIYSVECDVPFDALTRFNARNWRETLRTNHNALIFIDEGFSDYITTEFQESIRASDCYFIFVNRLELRNLTYSCDEIYTINFDNGLYTLVSCYNLRGINAENKGIVDKSSSDDVKATAQALKNILYNK